MSKQQNSDSSKPAKCTASTKQGLDSREKILDEAKKLFRQKGYEGVSINDIVEAVGVKKPTIYYYFGDKEGLFVEVLVAMLHRGGAFVANNVQPDMSTAEKLTQLSEGYLRFSPTSMMSMLRDTQNYLSPPSRQIILDAYNRAILTPLQAIFQEGIRQRHIKTVDTAELALTYMGLIDAITTQKSLIHGRDFNHSATATFVVETLLNGIKAPGQPSE